MSADNWPSPGPELVGAPIGPSATDGTPGPIGPSGPTPEEIERAAQSYARWSGEVLDMLSLGKGFAGRTDAEKASWLECWREEVKARPSLVKVGLSSLPPELGFLFFGIAFIKTRREWAQQHAAAEAAKREQEQTAGG